MVLTARFSGSLLLLLLLLLSVEHRLVEVGSRHSAVVHRVVASHHVRPSDPTQRLVVKSRRGRVQHESPFVAESTVGLQCWNSLVSKG